MTRSAAWLVVLALVVRQLHALEIPSALAHPGFAPGPDVAAAVVMRTARLLAIALGWYLLAATALTVVTAVAGVSGGAGGRLVRRAVPGTVHGLLRAVCGLSLAVTVTGQGPPATAREQAPITMHRLPSDAVATREQPPITMRRVDPTPPASADTPGSLLVEPSSTHVIAAGEHLWSVAEATLTRAWGRLPTDAEIDPYWRAVIERNRSKLPDPDNPDLVHPGAQLELPPVPDQDV